MSTDPFEELLLRAYPNPERNGCPGSLALRAAADNVVSFDDPTLQHVRQCSPCFAEFRVFRDARGNRERLRQVAVWTGIAALFIVCVSAIAFSIYRKSYHHIWNQTDLISAGNTGAKPVARLIALDFRSLNPERGAAVPSKDGATHSWTIPATLVQLRITLPFASDDGNYRLELRGDGDATVKKFSGVSVIKEGDTILTVDNVNFTGIPAGKYELLFAHADASWHVATVTVE